MIHKIFCERICMNKCAKTHKNMDNFAAFDAQQAEAENLTKDKTFLCLQ